MRLIYKYDIMLVERDIVYFVYTRWYNRFYITSYIHCHILLSETYIARAPLLQ